MPQIPSAEALRHARAALATETETIAKAGGRAPVTDPVITPFVRALRAGGFTIQTSASGCDALGTCPACQNRYLYTALRAGLAHAVCPHCRDAADRKAAVAGAARASAGPCPPDRVGWRGAAIAAPPA
ncbi:hypothetical protein [Cupriavidus sp. TMH.W2]|uniref:hypothetical protein n=1 Tax=Cupriavidus sp. TMH.W2 TaxID=3434465 RepID=UPI003D78088F